MTLPNIFVAGTKAKASEVNENFDYLDDRTPNLLTTSESADNTTQSDTISGSTSSSYTTKRTLSVPANTVTNFIFIRANIRGVLQAGNTSSITGSSDLQLTADSVQILERSSASKSDDTSDRPSVNQNSTGVVIGFKYTPSASEKTNGFTLDLDLKSSKNSTDGTLNTYNDFWEVWAH